MKSKELDLTNGSILNKLLLIAGPIMATQLFQMTYNLIDMFFVGRISSYAVAATGAAGMFMWLAFSLILVGSMGASIGVSQNKGRGDMDAAKEFATNSVFISLALGTVFAGIIITFAPFFISMLGIQEYHVIADAALYLRLVALAFPLHFANNAITGAFNGAGQSSFPFYLKLIGLVVNVIISPILIFNFDFGIMGAGIATAIGHGTTGLLLLWAIKSKRFSPFTDFSLRQVFKPKRKTIRQILKWTLPIAIESASFTLLTMLITNMIASFGAMALATKQIGVQMISLSFLIGGGYASAFTSFVGQNFGAKKFGRIKQGYKISLVVQTVWGSFVTILLVFAGGFFYRLFTDDPTVIEIGIIYMQIAAFVQIAGCLESVSAGTFRGLGKTIPPSIITITFNTLRVFIAFSLSQTSLGLYGVFIGEASGILLRGVSMTIWCIIYQKKNLKPELLTATMSSV